MSDATREIVDWKALAEIHEAGSEVNGETYHTTADMTIAKICRALAELVPQELPIPGENVSGNAQTEQNVTG